MAWLRKEDPSWNTLLCDMDETQGLNLGSEYRSDKSAIEFDHYIAEA